MLKMKSASQSLFSTQVIIASEQIFKSEGFVSNIEGILQRFKKILEAERDAADDEDVRKKAKNLLKKLWKVECGDEELKVIIEDPSGNSAIISDKAVITSLKKKK